MSAEIETLHTPFAKHVRENCPTVRVIRARSDRESTIARGWPDFTLLVAGKGPLLIEFKDKETPVSKHQKECHVDLASIGLTVYIVRELEIALTLVQEWLTTAPNKPDTTPTTGRIITKLWGGRLCSFREEANGRHTYLATKTTTP